MTEPARRLPGLDRWNRLSVRTRDTVGAGALLAVALMPGLGRIGIDLPEFPAGRMDALGWILVVAQCAPLVVRRWSPVLCAVPVSIAFATHQSLAYPITTASLALPVALYGLGAYQLRGRRSLALAGTAGYLVLAVVLHQRGAPERPFEYVTFYGVLVAFWASGQWMRTQRAAAEIVRRDSVTLAVATERAVIARELHDVVTHHVTAMVVQADAAGFVLASAPEKAAEGLVSVASTGRQALNELRHLLHVLDAQDSAADRDPVGGQLSDLVERTRRLGQPVEWHEEGAARPTGGVDLAVYRVVQEALTNAVKYAHGRPTTVRVTHTDQAVAVEVTTDGSAARNGGPVRSGRGLTGLRERVSVFGGDFEAGPTSGGGFLVRARIPVGSDA